MKTTTIIYLLSCLLCSAATNIIHLGDGKLTWMRQETYTSGTRTGTQWTHLIVENKAKAVPAVHERSWGIGEYLSPDGFRSTIITQSNLPPQLIIYWEPRWTNAAAALGWTPDATVVSEQYLRWSRHDGTLYSILRLDPREGVEIWCDWESMGTPRVTVTNLPPTSWDYLNDHGALR